MATYCQAGDRAKLLINGETIGTYTAPLNTETSAVTETFIPHNGTSLNGEWSMWSGWDAHIVQDSPVGEWLYVHSSQVGQPFAYVTFTFPRAGTATLTTSNIVKSGQGDGVTIIGPVSGTYQVTEGQTWRWEVNPKTTFFYDWNYMRFNISLASEITEITVTDGTGAIVHEATYNAEPTIEVQCNEALTEDEWRDKYQNENCDDLRECLECIDLALSQLPF